MVKYNIVFTGNNTVKMASNAAAVPYLTLLQLPGCIMVTNGNANNPQHNIYRLP